MGPRPCSEWLEAIERAAGTNLGPRLVEHLNGCEGCREALRVLGAVEASLAALAPEDPSPGFVEGVMRRLQPIAPSRWFVPTALLLAGGAAGSVLMATICALGLWLWLGTERIVTTLGLLAADLSGALLALFTSPSVPGLAAVGITLAVAVAAATGVVVYGRMAGGARGIGPR